MVLGRIFGPKKDEVTRECGKIHNEELYDLNCLPDIIRVIRSRMRWAGHVARVGERRGTCRVLVECLRDRVHLEDPGVDGKIILKWISRKWDGAMDWIDLAEDRDR